jgi:hypothetical protein
MSTTRALLTVALVTLATAGHGFAADSNAEQARFFEAKIRPLLVEHCWKCHGETKAKGGVRLDSLQAMLTGGDSGAAIVPGQPDESLLIQAVRYEGYEMPPSGQLSTSEVEALEAWVKLGAHWPGETGKPMPESRPERGDRFSKKERQWWAIQPVEKPDVPSEYGSQWARNEIDHFIARRLDREELAPAPEADRETLIRRLYFDLIGQPPTAEEVERFVNDSSSTAYEDLVDRLLDRPEYGQRFARHWLDVARYADSDGYRADHTRPNAWRYRDYVIESFNEDKPYDRFMMEQIAGDELFPDDPDARIATGFMTHGIYEYNNRDAVGQWKIMLDEITDTIGDVFLGVGMQCSKCHDHKFDPILQRDYYKLRAFVEPIFIETDTVCATREQLQAYEQADAKWRDATKSIREELDSLEAPYRRKAEKAAITRFPASVQAIFDKPEADRTPRELQIAELVWRQVEFEYDRMDSKFSKEDKERILELRRDLKTFDELKPSPLPRARTVRDVAATAPPTLIPKKRKQVEPGFLTIMESEPVTYVSAAAGKEPSASPGNRDSENQSQTTGRRSELARWLADAENPLSTRVIVNRVWQSHFGKGIAPNASDFGFLGGPPSHPDLLDWLTATFLENGWRFKPLHRLIVTSATYRQSGPHPSAADYRTLDPQNDWYWRFDVRRLDAEQIRDAILAVSGRLSDRVGGPAASDNEHRRSIYTIVKRNSRNPLLDAFDLPLFFTSTASRNTTTNPLQSLLLINSKEMMDHADRLAERVEQAPAAEAIERLWRLVYSRQPSRDEHAAALRFMTNQSQRHAPEAEFAEQDLPTSTLPYRDTAAIVVKPNNKARLRAFGQDAVNVDEFTIETVFQLASVYESGSVRSLVSTWDGNSRNAGWTFGVTGKGSRRKPQTLVMHMFGNDGVKQVTEAAIFSDQHIDLNKPYYAAATVKLGDGDQPGQVTFYLKDLSDDEMPMSVVSVEHDLISGIGRSSTIAVGGRIRGTDSVFDGLIDDVRLSSMALKEPQLLINDEDLSEATVAFWRFDPASGLTTDASVNGIDLQLNRSDERADSPRRRALADLCHVLLNSSEFLYVR